MGGRRWERGREARCQCGEQPSEALELSSPAAQPAARLTSSEWSQANRAGGFSRSALSAASFPLCNHREERRGERKPGGESLGRANYGGTIATLWPPLDVLLWLR